MPIRLRVVLLITLVLLFAMALGALAAGHQVRGELRAEMDAGLSGARQTAAGTFEDLPRSDHPERDLHQLVESFNGNRHVRASLTGAGGKVLWSSHSEQTDPRPPRWFHHLLGLPPRAVTLNVPLVRTQARALVLTSTPDLDIKAAWNEFVALIGVVVSATAAGLLLVYLVIGAAFRPLTLLAAQFKRIGAGDYTGRVEVKGPPELMSLQRGFNHMARELAISTHRNQLLTEQMARLQEEERADIARDLHDEIGPYLFAVNLDVQMITRLGEAGDHDAVPERLREIQNAVHHMQQQVRELLGRLRPTQLTEFGLNAAIRDLVRFWSNRQAGITFHLSLSEEPLPQPMAETVYRVVQEAVNNAVRHGKPETIRILVEQQGQKELLVSVTDDGTPLADEATGGGLGLIGMRERVEAHGGCLTHGPHADGAGWTTTANFMLHTRVQPEGFHP